MSDAAASATTLCPNCGAPVALGTAVCPACGAPLQLHLNVGHKLADERYSVGRVLGRGGFGITYQGADTRLGRTVAIKELFPEGATRQGARVIAPFSRKQNGFAEVKQRFIDEAQLLAQFNHPGIVSVLGIFEENQTAYLVMEFLRGATLSQWGQSRGPLTAERGLELTRQLAAALDVVHQAGLLHRDIKPDNVLVEGSGRAVLIDFGSARAYSHDQTVRHTQILTPGYAPPEQYASQARFGPYTDLYALGATLYHMFSGQRPPPATDRLMGTPLPPLPDTVPPDIADALGKVMALRVDERPQTVGAFLALLPITQRPRQETVRPNDDLCTRLAEAADGERLELPPGQYRLSKSLTIDRRLSVVGEDAERTVIVSQTVSQGSPQMLNVTASGLLSLQNVTLRYEGAKPADVIAIADGEGRFENVTLEGAKYALGHGGSGLLLTGRAVARLHGVTLTGNSRHGLEAYDDARLSLIDSVARDNRRCGLVLRGRARGELRDNRVTHNARHGLDLGGQAAPVLRNNEVDHNAQHGLCYRGAASGRAEYNTFRYNALSGVSLLDYANPDVAENTLAHNGQYGLCYLGTSGGEARDNRFEHNSRGNVAIAQSVRRWHPEGGPRLEPLPPTVHDI